MEISKKPLLRCHQGSVAETQSARKLLNITIVSNFPPDIDDANAINPKHTMSRDTTDSPVISITPIATTTRLTTFHNHAVDVLIDLKNRNLDAIPPFSVTHKGHRAMTNPTNA
ncbi:hypothetical protein LBMAG45_13220 [Nitrospirota bacterium]|nr:hypothetical protein LBMAG45_13220 [Nitrospirota bacterium]